MMETNRRGGTNFNTKTRLNDEFQQEPEAFSNPGHEPIESCKTSGQTVCSLYSEGKQEVFRVGDLDEGY